MPGIKSCVFLLAFSCNCLLFSSKSDKSSFLSQREHHQFTHQPSIAVDISWQPIWSHPQGSIGTFAAESASKQHLPMSLCIMPRWWLYRSFIFTLTWGKDPIWLINMFQIGRNGHLDNFFFWKQTWYSPRSWYHDSWLMSVGIVLLHYSRQGNSPISPHPTYPVKICRSSFPGVLFLLLGPILPKARNSTHEKMKFQKLYSNHIFSGEQREKKTWLFTYTGNYNYQSYVGIIMHHYKDPYEPTSIINKKVGNAFFYSGSWCYVTSSFLT